MSRRAALLSLACLVLCSAGTAAEELPRFVLARMGKPGPRAGGDVTWLAHSPDGKLLAGASLDKAVYLWDAATGQELRRLEGHKQGVAAVTFRDGGRLVATTGRDGTLRLWETATGKAVSETSLPFTWLTFRSLALSPDGVQFLCKTGPVTLQLRSTRFGTVVYSKPVPGEATDPIVYAPDGKSIASATAKAVRIWDAATGKAVHTIDAGAEALAFSADGKALAAVSARSAAVFDPASGKRLCDLDGHEGSPLSVFFAGDTKAVFVHGADGRVRRWDAATGKKLTLPDGCTGTAASLSPDGRQLAMTRGFVVTVWDVESGKEVLAHEGHPAPVAVLSFRGDGKRLASAGGDARVWDTASGKEVRKLAGQRSVAFAPEGGVMATIDPEGNVRLWDAVTGEAKGMFGSAGSPALTVALTPDGERAATTHAGKTSGVPGTLRVWAAGAGKETWATQLPGGAAGTVAFSNDGKRVATGGKQVLIWDSAGGKRQAAFDFAARTVAFSPDGRFVAGADTSAVRVWDAAGDKVADVPAGTPLFAFTPDGRGIVTAGPFGRLYGWEAVSGQRLWRSRSGDVPMTSLALTRDGTRMATGQADTTVLVWDLAAMADDGLGRVDGKAELPALWDALAVADAPTAHRAIRALAARGKDAVPFLRERLSGPESDEDQKIKRLVKQLDDDEFAAREKASEELKRLGGKAARALAAAVESSPSAEVRRRAEELLDAIPDSERRPPRGLTGDAVRVVRAVEALERIGEPAKDALGELARGPAEHRVTAEARAALARLGKNR